MEVWHLSVSYDGGDWIIRAYTGNGAHSVGLSDWKMTREVDGAEDDILDDDSVVMLGRSLIETVLRFADRLTTELVTDPRQGKFNVS
jgi:hypothetical protein